MKLYKVYLNNGMDYEDESHMTTLIVAKDLTNAKVKANQLLDDEMGHWMYEDRAYYEVEEVNSIDGYNIIIEDKTQ